MPVSGASGPGEYWENLLAGKDCRSRASQNRMGVDPRDYFAAEKGRADRFYCAQGGYITDFTPDFSDLDIPGLDLNRLDPLIQWSLHVAFQALKDSGHVPEKIPPGTGLVLGNLSFPTPASNALFIPMVEHAVESALQKAGAGPGFALPPWPGSKHTAWENGAVSGFPAAVIAHAPAFERPLAGPGRGLLLLPVRRASGLRLSQHGPGGHDAGRSGERG